MDGWGGGWADGWGEGESVKSRIQALYIVQAPLPPFTIAKLSLTGRSWYTSSDDGMFVEYKVDPMVGG